jgi:hypothetical protein
VEVVNVVLGQWELQFPLLVHIYEAFVAEPLPPIGRFRRLLRLLLRLLASPEHLVVLANERDHWLVT